MATITHHDLPTNCLLTTRQAAEHLGCSVNWLAQMRMYGQGPTYYKHGSWVRYRLGDIETWANQHRIAVTT
jgi:hypothetical protein